MTIRWHGEREGKKFRVENKVRKKKNHVITDVNY